MPRGRKPKAVTAGEGEEGEGGKPAGQERAAIEEMIILHEEEVEQNVVVVDGDVADEAAEQEQRAQRQQPPPTAHHNLLDSTVKRRRGRPPKRVGGRAGGAGTGETEETPTPAVARTVPRLREEQPMRAAGTSVLAAKVAARRRTPPRTRGNTAHDAAMAVHTSSSSSNSAAASSMIGGEEGEHKPRPIIDSYDLVRDRSQHCHYCTFSFGSELELTEHIRGHHKQEAQKLLLPRGQGTLLCAHPHCDAAFPGVAELIAHLYAYHNQKQYRIRVFHFNTVEQFEEWKAQQEVDAYASFIGAAPEHEISPGVFRHELYCEFCEEWRSTWKGLAEGAEGTEGAEQGEGEAPSAAAAAAEEQGEDAATEQATEVEQAAAPAAEDDEVVVEEEMVGMASVPGGVVERGGARPGERLRAIVACPAHILVTVDRNKGKVSVSGCVAHLGHLKKPSWSSTLVNEPVHMTKPMRSICGVCGVWFRSNCAMQRHRRTEHPSTVRTPTIECGDAECDTVVDTMMSLVAHVSQVHKRDDLVVEEYKFNSFHEFEIWRARMETDTVAHFTKVSGKLRGSRGGMEDSFFRYYLCTYSGHTIRAANKRKDPAFVNRPKLRARTSKKMGRYCTAFMNIRISDSDGSVVMKGCLGHFGHPQDVRALPLPFHVRQEIAELLSKGVTEEDVLNIIKGKASESERAFYLQRYEVRNVVKKLIRESNGHYFYRLGEDDDEAAENEAIAAALRIQEGREGKDCYAVPDYRHIKLTEVIPSPMDSSADGGVAMRRRKGVFEEQFARRTDVMKRRLEWRADEDEDDLARPGESSSRVKIPRGVGGRGVERAVRRAEMQLDDELVASSSHHHFPQRRHIGEELVEEVDGIEVAAEEVYYEDGAGVPHHHDLHHQHQHGMVEEEEEMHQHMLAESAKQHSHQEQQRQRLLATRRNRVPILRDVPQPSGNKQFDQVMSDIKRNIDTISRQLRATNDLRAAEGMLEEIKSLETKLVANVGQTTAGQRWHGADEGVGGGRVAGASAVGRQRGAAALTQHHHHYYHDEYDDGLVHGVGEEVEVLPPGHHPHGKPHYMYVHGGASGHEQLIDVEQLDGGEPILEEIVDV